MFFLLFKKNFIFLRPRTVRTETEAGKELDYE